MFRVIWGIDVILGVVALVVFVIGIRDGSVSSVNVFLWLLLLGGLAAIVFGSGALHRNGHGRLALLLGAVLAVPALVFGVGTIVSIAMGGRWN